MPTAAELDSFLDAGFEATQVVCGEDVPPPHKKISLLRPNVLDPESPNNEDKNHDTFTHNANRSSPNPTHQEGALNSTGSPCRTDTSKRSRNQISDGSELESQQVLDLDRIALEQESSSKGKKRRGVHRTKKAGRLNLESDEEETPVVTDTAQVVSPNVVPRTTAYEEPQSAPPSKEFEKDTFGKDLSVRKNFALKEIDSQLFTMSEDVGSVPGRLRKLSIDADEVLTEAAMGEMHERSANTKRSASPKKPLSTSLLRKAVGSPQSTAPSESDERTAFPRMRRFPLEGDEEPILGETVQPQRERCMVFSTRHVFACHEIVGVPRRDSRFSYAKVMLTTSSEHTAANSPNIGAKQNELVVGPVVVLNLGVSSVTKLPQKKILPALFVGKFQEQSDANDLKTSDLEAIQTLSSLLQIGLPPQQQPPSPEMPKSVGPVLIHLALGLHTYLTRRILNCEFGQSPRFVRQNLTKFSSEIVKRLPVWGCDELDIAVNGKTTLSPASRRDFKPISAASNSETNQTDNICEAITACRSAISSDVLQSVKGILQK